MKQKRSTSRKHKEVRVCAKSESMGHKPTASRSSAAVKQRIRKAAADEKHLCGPAWVYEAAVTRDVLIAAWNSSAAKHGWEPQHTKGHCERGSADTSFDRYDVAGTTNINELVLRHGTMRTSDLKTTRHPALYQRVGKLQNRSDSPFMLDRYLSNLVRALVHPLHNYLQCHHGLHNADEVQVMLMPKDGPIALADRTSAPPCHASSLGGSSALRRCYVATNNETLTQKSLQEAVADWGVAEVFQIGEFVLVTGEKGCHAEQKLLRHLRLQVLRRAALPVLATADQKALVVGERLPCVACRLFAIAFEPVAVLLPSHGHFYLSTIPSPGVETHASAKTGEDINAMFANPAVAAALLLAPGGRRVLQ